jgi:hypothetical protein
MHHETPEVNESKKINTSNEKVFPEGPVTALQPFTLKSLACNSQNTDRKVVNDCDSGIHHLIHFRGCMWLFELGQTHYHQNHFFHRVYIAIMDDARSSENLTPGDNVEDVFLPDGNTGVVGNGSSQDENENKRYVLSSYWSIDQNISFHLVLNTMVNTLSSEPFLSSGLGSSGTI